MSYTPENVREFVRENFRHFNAAALKDAAEGWIAQLQRGNRMFLTLAGAMSTAELGITIAELIRRGKVHGICCTGANLEEDVFNLVAHDHYERVPNYRDLSPADEQALLERHLNRVTDTCIPEEEAMRRIEGKVFARWKYAHEHKERFFPHEYLYQVLKSGELSNTYQIDPRNSWLLAAAERDLPLFVPGWEDSTLGNMFVSHVLRHELSYDIVKSGPEYMGKLVGWYQEQTLDNGLGFFQVGGGIAGDFPICVVPLIEQDMGVKDVKKWSYFCQISDSTTSYGSYSGAVPNEKITWGKLDAEGPKFIIESDATIVAPLIFNYVLAGD
jgi:deoxyhypusine synthase